MPQIPAEANTSASRDRAQSLCRMNPMANPAKAKAAQGKTGNSQACGVPRLCTPFTYDSIGQGSQFGRHVVHSGGVSKAIEAAIAPEASTRNRMEDRKSV